MLHISNLTPDSFVEGAEPVEILRPRKRQRKVLSCDSCHRQKVKCDRRLPCSRCIAGNRGDKCSYNGTDAALTPEKAPEKSHAPLQEPSPASSNTPNPPQKPVKPPISTYWRKGRARFSGLTHWAQLALKMDEAGPFIRGDARELTTLLNRMKTLKSYYPPKLKRAFPFGDSCGDATLVARDRLSFMPPKHLAELLTGNYLSTYERNYPLLDTEEFKTELNAFWNSPDNFSDAWLAQLYMILALSCYASPGIAFDEVIGGSVGLATRCIDGAQAALLTRGYFSCKPDLTSLRVLCLLSIARQLDIVTLEDSDGSWVFMGFVMRVGMSMSLHINPLAFDTMPKKEAMARRRIMNTMMLLDSTTALDSGMPLLLRPQDYDSVALFRPDSNDDGSSDASATSMLADENYQSMLAATAPVVASIVNQANSTSPRFSADQIRAHDTSIVHLLRKAQFCITSQRTVLEVILHRCLLAMHQSCGLIPNEHCHDPEHCKKTLHESSMGLLYLQAYLAEDSSHHWLGDLFVRNFGVAGLHVCDGIRSYTFDDSADPMHGKVAAMAALKKAKAIIKSNVGRSRHYFKMYKAYTALLAGLEAVVAGTSIRDALFQAGMEIIQAVEQCMSPQMGSGGSLASLVDPILQLDSPDFEFSLSGVEFEFPFDEFLSEYFWAT